MHPRLRALLWKWWYRVWAAVAAGVILLALVISLLRVLFPLVPGYKADLEKLATDVLKHQVSIGRVTTDWKWFRPRLKLLNLVVQGDGNGPPLLEADQLILGVNLFGSVIQGKLDIDDITLAGSTVVISRDNDGTITVQNRVVFAPKEKPGAAAATTDAVSQDKSKEAGSTARGQRIKIPPELQNRTIRLADINIEYHDRIMGLDYRAPSVDLALNFKSSSAALYLDIALPDELGERLEFAIETYGSIKTPNDLDGRIFFRGTGLKPAAWKQPGWLQQHVQSGVVDLSLWIDVQQPKKISLSGLLDAHDVVLTLPQTGSKKLHSWKAERAQASYFAAVDGKEIRAGISDLQLTKDGRTWPGGNISFRTPKQGELRFKRGELAVDFLRLEDIFPWVSAYVFPHVKQLKNAGLRSMHGDVANLYADWDLTGEQPRLKGVAEIRSLEVDCNDNLPSIKGFDGAVRVLDNRMAVVLDVDALQVKFPRLFRKPLPPVAITGELLLQRTGNGFSLAARGLQLNNSDIQSSHWFDYEFVPGDKSVLANHYSRFEVFDSRSTSRYLPANIMSSEKGVQWLDNAFISGGVKNGEFTLRGPLKKMPFRNGEGIFRIEFDTSNNVLNFWEPGPFATNIRAHAVFDGPSMLIYGYQAKVLDSTAQDITVRIDDFHDAPLLVSANLYGSMADAWEYIKQTKIRDVFAVVADQLSVTGTQATRMELNIPMHNNTVPPEEEHHTDVLINGGVHNGSLHFKDWKLDFTDVNTPIRITEKSVEAEPFSAQLNGQPVTLSVDSAQADDRNTITAHLQGDVAAGDFLHSVDIPVADFVNGHGQVSAEVEIPVAQDDDANRHKPALRINSDLQGIALSLPPPLDKAASAKAPLSINTVFDGPQFNTQFRYDGWMRGALRSVHGEGAPRITHADIRLGGGTPRLVAEPGIFVRGHVDAVNVDRWLTMPWMHGTDTGTLDYVKSVDLLVDQFTYLHRTVNGLQLNLERQEHNWRFKLNSKLIRGLVLVPINGFNKRSLSINLEYADYDGISAGYTGEVPQPSDIPPFSLEVDRLKFNTWDLRNLVILADRSENAVKFHTLRIDDPAVGLEGSGEWVVDEHGEHRTSAHLEFNSNNIGEGLNRFNFQNIIKGGKGKASFDISWPAPPSGFDLAIFSGNATLDLKKGLVPELDPGGGRILGLLNLQMIPRRLALDFRDLFNEGYAFDDMSGTFTFSDGNAYTDNYHINGPVGRIDIAGRTGLVKQDYDQHIVFRPKLSSSLPVIGAILGGASGGWAMVVMDNMVRIFGGDTDNLAKATYTVTGSWDDPVITPVKNPGKKKQQSSQEQAEEKNDGS